MEEQAPQCVNLCKLIYKGIKHRGPVTVEVWKCSICNHTIEIDLSYRRR